MALHVAPVPGILRLNDGVTAPSAVVGLAHVYVDSADGDLKILFADGTIKTLTTDVGLTSWTPAISIGGSTTGITYTAANGRYQIEGKAVEASFDFTLSSKGVGTGSVTMNLPVPAATGQPFPGGVLISYYTGMASITGQILGYIVGSSVTLGVGTSTGLGSMNNAHLSDTTQMVGKLHYFAA